MEIEAAVNSLAALAQKSRLAVFRYLVERGSRGATPGELIAHFDMSPSSLSFHLKSLLHAGLIDAEQISRSITYRANYRSMQGLVDFLTENCCGGEPALCNPAVGKAAIRSAVNPLPKSTTAKTAKARK